MILYCIFCNLLALGVYFLLFFFLTCFACFLITVLNHYFNKKFPQPGTSRKHLTKAFDSFSWKNLSFFSHNMIWGEVNWTGKEILLKGSFDSTHNDLLSDSMRQKYYRETRKKFEPAKSRKQFYSANACNSSAFSLSVVNFQKICNYQHISATHIKLQPQRFST